MCILYVHFHANKTHFLKKGFALSLVLKKKVKRLTKPSKRNPRANFWQVNKLKALWR